MTDLHIWLLVAVIALTTAAIRFLPFIIFGKNKKPPKIIKKLGNVLPYATMGMLVVYCLKDISFGSLSDFMPALISCIVVALVHIKIRNTLLSIVSGTVCYMILLQLVFK